MTLPLSLPDWLPWWVPLAVLAPLLLYLLVFLLMPFSVFGLKSRLDILEAQLDAIHQELRALAARQPPGRREEVDWPEPAPPVPRRPERPAEDRPLRPPVPPRPFQVPRRSPLDAPPPGAVEPEPPPPRAPVEPELPAAPEVAPASATPYRRPLLRPTRTERSEPRLDWPR